jgi:hypothetical protein
MSKSNLVREYLESHPTASVRQITEDLKEHHISDALAGMIKYSQPREMPSPPRIARRRPAPHRRTETANPSTPERSKADDIREVARAMGKRVLPREVSASLAARGIEVSRGQISQVLKSMGLRRRRRKRSAPTTSTPAIARGKGGVSIDDLVAAKKLADQLGGIEKARAVLAGLARLM